VQVHRFSRRARHRVAVLPAVLADQAVVLEVERSDRVDLHPEPAVAEGQPSDFLECHLSIPPVSAYPLTIIV